MGVRNESIYQDPGNLYKKIQNGDLAKIYLFKSEADFVAYQECSDASPYRAATMPYVAEKVYAGLKVLKKDVPPNGIGSSPFATLAGVNTSDAKSFVQQRTQLLDAVTGMTLYSSTSEMTNSFVISDNFSTKVTLQVRVRISH